MEFENSSGNLAASTGAAVVSRDSIFTGAEVYDATGDAILTVYRGTAATAGNEICVVAASDESQFGASPKRYIPCEGGIYYVLTGAGSTARVFYI